MWVFRSIPVFLCLIYSSISAVAQTTTVPVRAGEHSDFTRLSIQLPESNDWQITQDGHLAELTISGPALDFDLSQTFARIPRTRLGSVVQTPTGLEIRLNCDCLLRASEDLPRYLVMDVTEIAVAAKRPAATTPRPQARPEQAILRPAETPAPVHGPALAAGQSLASALTGRSLAPQQRQSLLLEQIVGTPAADDVMAAGAPPSPARSDVIAQGMTHDLGRALSEAVGLGLLSPNQEIATTAPPRLSTTDDPPSRHVDRQGIPPHGQMTITDSVAAARGAAPRSLQNDIFAICPPDDTIDPSLWQTQASSQLTPVGTAALFNEADTLDPGATRNLVRQYLYLGFGAEARLTLSLLNAPQPQDRFLEMASHLVDLTPLPTDFAQLDISPCGGMATLWQALAILPDDLPDDYPIAGLVQAIQALPAHLRLHLGPHIVRHLAAQGFVSDAHSIRDSLDRISETSSDPLRLARATLDLPRASGQDTRRYEQDLLADPTIEAVTFLMQRQQDLDLPISPELAEEAHSLLRALRGSDEGHMLAKLLARGLSRTGQFAEALSLVRLNDADIPPQENVMLLRDLLLDLTGNADDTTFVTQMFEHTPWNSALPDEARAILASRLDSLGFDEQADLMGGVPLPLSRRRDDQDSNDTTFARQDLRPLPEAATMTSQTPAMGNSLDMSPAESDRAEDQDAAPAESDDTVDLEFAQSSVPAAPTGFDLPAGLLSAGQNTVQESTRLRARLNDVLQSGP